MFPIDLAGFLLSWTVVRLSDRLNSYDDCGSHDLSGPNIMIVKQPLFAEYRFLFTFSTFPFRPKYNDCEITIAVYIVSLTFKAQCNDCEMAISFHLFRLVHLGPNNHLSFLQSVRQ